ncbi:hypothetical protein [Streptosporangium canum]|uniref:hypothetical protein n=1 Tax=Streptosporangium canum TaxID=324952 RepID=UPI003791416A
MATVLTVTACASPPAAHSVRPAPSAATPDRLPARPAPPQRAEPAQQQAAVTAARRFTHRLLTYTYRTPQHLPPSARLNGLITHRYAAALAARDSIDPALALSQHETSRVRITRARPASDAPNDAGTQYVQLACIQTLTAAGRSEHIAMTWSLRLLRYPTGWRVDEVTQAG